MIEGLLQLPVMEMRTPHKMAADEDPLRRRLWIKGKAREHALQSENNKSARATLILDLMEPFHEPTGAVYAALIASHGEDASAEQDGDAATATVCRQQAWRSAKAALQLLNRSEDFYLHAAAARGGVLARHEGGRGAGRPGHGGHQRVHRPPAGGCVHDGVGGVGLCGRAAPRGGAGVPAGGRGRRRDRHVALQLAHLRPCSTT